MVPGNQYAVHRQCMQGYWLELLCKYNDTDSWWQGDVLKVCDFSGKRYSSSNFAAQINLSTIRGVDKSIILQLFAAQRRAMNGNVIQNKYIAMSWSKLL